MSTSVGGRDEDENGEQLDYYDDIGPPPYDPMDAEASEDVLRGPTMEVSSSQETELLDDLSGTAHGAGATEPDTTATGVTKQLSRLTPEGLDAVAAELNRLRASRVRISSDRLQRFRTSTRRPRANRFQRI